VMFTQWALRADVFLFGERGRFAPPGVLGGEAAAMNRFSFETEEGTRSPPLASKMVGIDLHRGRHLRLESPGGGYGPPDQRDPKAVARDVALGYVSAEAAARDYLVAVGPDGTVDAAGTAALREAS